MRHLRHLGPLRFRAALGWALRSPLRRVWTPLLLATTVTLTNAGFEDLYFGSNLPAQYAGVVPAGSFPTGPAPSGWTPYYQGGGVVPNTFLGVLNPGTAAQFAPNPSFFVLGAPEGNNAVLLFTSGDQGGLEYGVEQTLGATLEAGRNYHLSVQVGNIGGATALVQPYSGLGYFNIDGFPGYRLQLLAGGAVIAEDVDSVLPDERQWLPASLDFIADADHPRLGQALGIRLVNRNQPDLPGVSGIEVDFDDVRLTVGRLRQARPLQVPAQRAFVSVGPFPFSMAILIELGARARFHPRDRN